MPGAIGSSRGFIELFPLPGGWRAENEGVGAAKARGVALGNPQQAARNRELARTEAENLRPVLTELKHLSSRQIAAELTLRGVATPRGGKWQSPTVLRLINRLELR